MVRFVVYPGAAHAFDLPEFGAGTKVMGMPLAYDRNAASAILGGTPRLPGGSAQALGDVGASGDPRGQACLDSGRFVLDTARIVETLD